MSQESLSCKIIEKKDILFINSTVTKKIFLKKELENFLKKEKPEIFRGKRYIGNDIWNELYDIYVDKIRKYTRNYVVENPNGKYYQIHRNKEKTISLLEKSNISKENSPCHPERFSEDIVKKNVRNELDKYFEGESYSIDDLFKNLHQENTKKLFFHEKERLHQQLKSDYTEYLLLQSDENIIPTLKNTKGTDMYLIEDNKIIDLDIKTTRNVWGLENNPQCALRELYKKQGEDRFSANPRTIIYYTSNTDTNKEEIRNQLYQTYDIDFIYKKKLYSVKGTRFIII